MNCLRLLLIRITFLAAACSQLSTAQTIDWDAVHKTTMGGLRQLYNLEVDSALQTFGTVSRMAPGDPRGPFFTSMVHFYLYGLNRDEHELSTFLDQADQVIEICEGLLKQNDHDAKTEFYLGGIYGYRGMAFQTEGSILKAARDGRKGYLLLEEAVRDDPHLYDAQMGFGLFRYLIAKLPKSMSWVLSVLGFEGDLEGGMQSLRWAAEKGVYTRVEAKLFLAQFLFNEGRRDTALQVLAQLRHEYPENTLFLVLYASWQNRLGNLDEALAAARSALMLNDRKKVRYGEEFVYSTLGSIYFTRNDFTEATKYYRLYLELVREDERIPAYTFYRAGVACEIGGDRPAAVRFYRMMKRRDGFDHSWNAFYQRKGEEYLERPLTRGEILVIEGGNEQTRKQYPSAKEFYQKALDSAGNNIDVRARALYGFQQIEFESGHLAEALAISRQITALAPPVEKWVLPHAWLTTGEILAKMGDIADARAAYEKAKSYDDYDFQNRVEEQVKEALKKLDEGTKATR